MACIAILFSTAAALVFSASLVAFGDPSLLQVALGYLVVAKTAFWMVIVRLSLGPAQLNAD